MTGIDHRPRLGVGPQGMATKQLRKYRVLGDSGVEVEQCQGGVAGDHNTRCVDGLRQHMGREGITQAGKAVIKSQFVEGFQ